MKSWKTKKRFKRRVGSMKKRIRRSVRRTKRRMFRKSVKKVIMSSAETKHIVGNINYV